MAIYTVVPFGGPNEGKLNADVAKLGSDNTYMLPGGAGWLVKFPGTTKELAAKIGVPSSKEEMAKMDAKTIPHCLITALDSMYYGYGSSDMWSWIASRSED